MTWFRCIYTFTEIISHYAILLACDVNTIETCQNVYNNIAVDEGCRVIFGVPSLFSSQNPFYMHALPLNLIQACNIVVMIFWIATIIYYTDAISAVLLFYASYICVCVNTLYILRYTIIYNIWGSPYHRWRYVAMCRPPPLCATSFLPLQYSSISSLGVSKQRQCIYIYTHRRRPRL